jgi:hypothetical protein
MRTAPLLLFSLLWLSCATDAEKPIYIDPGGDTGAPSDDTDAPDDPADSDDTSPDEGTGTPPDSGDSGEPEDLVPATVTQGDPIVCADPGARASVPLVSPDFGADWAAQNATGGSADPIAAGGLTIADLTGDGLTDIYLPQVGTDQLYIGQSDGSFTDETSIRLPDYGIPSATAATAVDIEGDGDLDLFITTSLDQNRLLLNDGTGHFTDNTEAAGLAGQGWPAAASLWGDMDGDEDLDLFVVTFRTCDPAITTDPDNPWADTPQALWENQGDGTFVDVTERIPEHPGGEGRFRAGAWIDLDGDWDLDLHLVSDRGVSSSCMEPNRVYRNDGETFTEASAGMALDITMEGMGLGIGDLNEDGIPDFGMSDMRRLWIVESDPTGAWYDSTAVRGLRYDPDAAERWSGWGMELADLDNDTDLDLFMTFGGLPDAPPADMNPMEQPDALFLQSSEDGTFTEVSAEWGVDDMDSNRATVIADINGDGWLDLARRTLDGAATVLLAQCGAESWISVDLHQPGANPRAIGAIVRVVTGERTLTRWITAGATGLQSSSPAIAHFGLSDATQVDRLDVRWPDGTLSRFTTLEVNRLTAVTRADDE